ncbi:acyltransferase family protein [Methylosinus sp. H3A]|uniref:acyltransferase family protein n=1 Tax=Methylosinus sp. H3A TaxID=2785786 RepID=UPI0018C2BC23|nr:acyltransferase family protein [Methylosinus sp. H3A]MBG0808030.1 acyltransferase family protein [Methylosinus sp. H3A]
MINSMSLSSERVDWVDYAKGFCIIFVVMMHSTLGVEAAVGREGFMHYLVAFAKPFRMPDFFLISGLFLARVIDRDWKTYLDRKVAHFAYFYVLWATIQFVVKIPSLAAELSPRVIFQEYLLIFIQPFGTLWFVYLLPVFFILTKLFRRAPPWVLWSIAAALEISCLETGVLIMDEFASRFVYFYTGYLLAPRIFGLAKTVQLRPLSAMTTLLLWALANGFLVSNGQSERPFVSLGLGLFGACAVVGVSALMSMYEVFAPLRYCGRNSIVIYLGFFLPMAASRIALVQTGLITDVGLISVFVTIAGVLGSLTLFWLVRGSDLGFLFARPRIFWLDRNGVPGNIVSSQR